MVINRHNSEYYAIKGTSRKKFHLRVVRGIRLQWQGVKEVPQESGCAM